MAPPTSLLFSLIQEFSKWGPQSSSRSNTWELVSNAYSWASPRPIASESLEGVGPRSLEFYKHPRWFWCKLTFQNIFNPSSDQAGYFFSNAFSYFLKMLFYSSIVNLQCCINFCCIAKWFSYTYAYILFHILFHYGLSQDIVYSSLCYTGGPCCLSILYIIVCIWSHYWAYILRKPSFKKSHEPQCSLQLYLQ